jgi:AraC-like DNA-binding protein
LLADTKLSITLVAEQSGFGSSSDFARAFRSAEGVTPRAYREQAGPA